MCVYIFYQTDRKREVVEEVEIYFAETETTFLRESHNRTPQVLVKHTRVISETLTHMGSGSHI